MLQKVLRSTAMLLLLGVFSFTPTAAQQNLQQQESQNDYDSHDGYQSNQVRIDRYLNAEVWTDNDDGEYYEGDRVTIYFRSSRDAFVAIYSIDTKGRVNMLFPSTPNQDNYVVGGETHSLPSRSDDYDLVVSGPEGVENIQIIASREPFPIPDWYPNSGLFCDWENRHDYMDWVNGQFFVKYGGQRFAYDRTAMYIYEWEPNYFRPVYRPYYPGWTVSGNVYVDYWYGSSIYIDGIYWGCAPLYLPRLYVGWHTFTVYDRYGYCWERDVHVTRYNTVVINHNVINTQPTVRSKYKEVRFAGYQNPVNVGYKDYDKKVKVMTSSGAWKTSVDSKVTVENKVVEKKKTEYVVNKKFVRGSSKVVTTERGIETAGADINRGETKRGTTVINNQRGTSGQTSIDRSKKSSVSSGSIFKRRDTDSPSEKNATTGKDQLRTTDVKRKTNTNSGLGSKNQGSSGSSGSYKKSSSSPVKKNTAPKKATVKKSGDNNNSAPKKSSGTVKSSGSDNKGSSSPPKKSSSGAKKSSGGSKKKGGGK